MENWYYFYKNAMLQTTALIVDDERLARNALRRLLSAHPTLSVLGEAAHADEAKEAIEKLRPNVLFLDIQMPVKSGFELLAELDFMPHVIFTTAFDQYALRAFEVSALDYLVKPIEPERLAEALKRVPQPQAEVLTEKPTIDYLKADEQVFVKDGERCWFVRIGDVRLIESEGNYTRLYFDRERPLILRSLNQLEERLDPAMFFRANRSQILNLRYIRKLDTWANGMLLAELTDGQRVELSRRRAQDFRERMSL
ncbi:MAG TPA: LytTR family DNA-binding domain-containing protein [Rhodothermales bacterium]|nr:LytTR family DNA-binding domain-containing protein [Rhodothermales bacterium]